MFSKIRKRIFQRQRRRHRLTGFGQDAVPIIDMLTTLPTEILLEIFDYLDPITLRLAISLVCRRFRSILSKAPLPPGLYRQPFVSTARALCVMHPIFSLLHVREKPSAECYTINDILFNDKPLTTTVFASDNATRPPCGLFYVNTILGIPAPVAYKVSSPENDGGVPVTVLQIARRIVVPLNTYRNRLAYDDEGQATKLFNDVRVRSWHFGVEMANHGARRNYCTVDFYFRWYPPRRGGALR